MDYRTRRQRLVERAEAFRGCVAKRLELYTETQHTRFCVVCGKKQLTPDAALVTCSEACFEFRNQQVQNVAWHILETGYDEALHILQIAEDNGRVYFVRAEPSGMIKIGTSTDVKSRLNSLRHNTAECLELLVEIPGDRTLETRIHNRFRQHREHGEWFRPESELLEYIEALKRGERP